MHNFELDIIALAAYRAAGQPTSRTDMDSVVHVLRNRAALVAGGANVYAAALDLLAGLDDTSSFPPDLREPVFASFLRNLPSLLDSQLPDRTNGATVFTNLNSAELDPSVYIFVAKAGKLHFFRKATGLHEPK